MYQKYIKQILDSLFAIILLVLTAPLVIASALAVKLDSPGPIIFRQKRYGKNGRVFNVYKFRTMSLDAPHDSPTNSLQDPHIHITRTGRIMRKLSLDELPQLVNVLRGEMSIVGPRPVILKEASLIAERKKNGAHSLKPGITGWAQVNGRDELRMEEKARMDGEYADNIGFRIDARCIALTLWAVLSIKGHREGIVEAEEVNVTN
jgi:O-antigen biosynthesis protein WbqP